jgi:hypothetical protein
MMGANDNRRRPLVFHHSAKVISAAIPAKAFAINDRKPALFAGKQQPINDNGGDDDEPE